MSELVNNNYSSKDKYVTVWYEVACRLYEYKQQFNQLDGSL